MQTTGAARTAGPDTLDGGERDIAREEGEGDSVSLQLYMDEHVPSAITEGLRQRGVEVLTAQEDGQGGVDDPVLLDRATALGRVLFTQDTDLLAEGTRRQQAGEPFAGVVYAHQVRVTIGRCVQDLELLAGASGPGELVGQIVYLPLR